MSCKSYKEGLQAGCMVSNKKQTCSTKFKKDVSACIKFLAKAFNKIGAKEVESFLHLIEMDAPQPPAYAPASTPDVAGLDMNVEVKQKRKAVFVEGVKDAEKKKTKDIGRTFYPCTFKAPSDFTLAKVLVEEGEEVERGQPLYIMGQRKPYVWNPSISSRIPTLSELTIKKTLRRNWKSRAGIFSMEDVFVDQNHNHQMEGLDNEEDVLKLYQNFNKFDTVVDHTDHFFSAESSSMKKQPEEWVDKIREEWRILAEYLPETIFVRIYEDRMDLLRAVIVGPRETPYHNGLFFFDVCFPSDYPDSPPLVHYRSGGLGINPNLYKCGKVSLSLPKTSCGQETMWVLGSSTMLQLLISIQDRILNANPLFNDMTYSVLSGSVYGKESSVLYNQNTFIKTLKTMVYTMKSLPRNFEVFVVGHFRNLFGDILAACDKEAKETGSLTFKNDLNACIKQLAAAFSIIGPKGTQKLSSS
ncbi:ubiquitin-conjugating enzyme/RWD-like protein [Artemisia annua]|uniref:Ubiquitin-conjugating enzyme/RWD-like protein n=1 Tax=Artemisia annua TaxID=35608 RepID=A0A2U1M7S2_ARTAN|nr:ubiquitin-conjugating enzyme/RWD-like protein [Artemisia annua]